ncbi:hypothetical protein [Pseudomonas sp. Irchel 3A5]|uniref:hypothetical protein n=1 Tax=Pseudomonas sp. Irchel 3A5 TaxID=2008911 RepID=UPI000BA455DF|nr:hypothetical protein [Pseudomonas sp. Irchel 3A5]
MTDNFILAANQRQSQLEAAKAAFFASGGQMQIGPGVPDHPLPPVRKSTIDPETVLKRKKPALSRTERGALRKMAASI